MNLSSIENEAFDKNSNIMGGLKDKIQINLNDAYSAIPTQYEKSTNLN